MEEVARKNIEFVYARLADEESLVPGQDVIAIGTPLGFLQNTVSRGIVSGLRPLKTKKGDRMAVFMLDDIDGGVEVGLREGGGQELLGLLLEGLGPLEGQVEGLAGLLDLAAHPGGVAQRPARLRVAHRRVQRVGALDPHAGRPEVQGARAVVRGGHAEVEVDRVDAADEEGVVYVVHEWGAGYSLDKLVAEGPLPPAQ